MSKPRFTETQIVALLKEAESGIPVPELCRRERYPEIPIGTSR